MSMRLWQMAAGTVHPSMVRLVEIARRNPEVTAWTRRRVPIRLPAANAGPELLGLKISGLEKGAARKGDFLFADRQSESRHSTIT
jgi:hypothetical protein